LAERRSPLFDELSNYDGFDTLSRIAALHLLPSNGEKAVRLESLSRLAASLPSSQSQPSISSSRFRRVVETDRELNGLTHLEDPSQGPFCEALTFFGGSRRVLPGAMPGIAATARAMIKGVLLGGRQQMPREFLREVYERVAVLLTLSDEMCRRASILRNTPSVARRGEPIDVPGGQLLATLATAVRFSRDEIGHLLPGVRVADNLLSALAVQQGAIPWTELDPDKLDPLTTTPLVALGDRFVIALPYGMCEAVCSQIRSLALEYDALEQVHDLCLRTTWGEVIRSTSHLVPAARFIQGPDTAPSFPVVFEGALRVDADKILYLSLSNTGSLGDSGEETGLVDGTDLLDRAKEVLESAKRVTGGDVDKVTAVLLHGFGRSVIAVPDHDVDCLVMSAADWCSLCRVLGPNPLFAWRYTRDRKRLKSHSTLHCWSELDSISVYLDHDHSFHFGDDQRSAIVCLAPMGAGVVRQKEVLGWDPHAVPSWEHGRTVEVVKLHDNTSVAVYIADAMGPRGDVYLEVDEHVGLWILGQNENGEPSRLAFAIAGVCAYWLWRVRDWIRLVDAREHVLQKNRAVRVVVQDAEAWFQPSPEPGELGFQAMIARAVTVDSAEPSTPIVRVTADFPRCLELGGNRAEVALARAVVECLFRGSGVSLGPQPQAELDARLAEESSVPDRRMLNLLDPNVDPSLSPQGLRPPVKLMQSSIDEVLDRVIDSLVAHGHHVGDVFEGREAVSLLNAVVGDLYALLRSRLSELSPSGLAEGLVGQYEAQLATTRLAFRTLRSSVACFDNQALWIEELKRSLPRETTAAIASRFLLEHMAAEPPAGQMVLTDSLLEELLALASQIVDFGIESELVYHALADHKFSYFPSGRLGADRSEFRAARDSFLQLVLFEQLTCDGRAEVSGLESILTLERLNLASRAEWGYPISSAATVLGELSSIALDGGGGACAMTRSKLIERLRDAAGLPEAEIDAILTNLTLGPRNSFLTPPAGFVKADVYPWRFNRSLSYLRRPLIARQRDTGIDLVWGPRHVSECGPYLVDLIASSRYKARSPGLKRLLAELSDARGRAFQRHVADFIRSSTGMIVAQGWTGAGEARIPADLGDVDVMVLDPRRRTLWAFECKDFEAARTPAELANEIERLVDSGVPKHKRRIAWLSAHASEVVRCLDPGAHSEGFKVEGAVVLDTPLLSPFLRQTDLPIVPAAQALDLLK